jgi:hypothetical protein
MNTLRAYFISICILAVVTTCHGQATSELFEFEKDDILTYEITIDFTQNGRSDSYEDEQSYSNEIKIEGQYLLYLSLAVGENYGEYFELRLTYDSLKARFDSMIADSTTSLEILALHDRLQIYRNDSLIDLYDPVTANTAGTSELYQKLLFVGEPIVMLAYPSGEIFNLLENKNLYQMARELFNYPASGFLQISLPDQAQTGQAEWEEAVSGNSLAGFELEKSLPPLIFDYKLRKWDKITAINYSGELEIDDFTSSAGTPDFENRLMLSADLIEISKSGAVEFSTGRMISNDFTFDMKARLSLKGDEFKSFELFQDIVYKSNTRIRLINVIDQ